MAGRVTAIVPAAGVGKRFGEGTNKPLALLCGKPLLIWALEALEAVAEISEIIPVVKEADMAYLADLFESHPVPKVRRVVPGGKERHESVLRGLNCVEDPASVIVVHDGVRPLITPAVISSAIRQLEDCDGVVVGVPVKDTIKEVHQGIVKTLRRDLLWAAQTPQVFRSEALRRAYEKAEDEELQPTDDSALVERCGGKIKMVMGSYTNVKITTPEDMLVAEAFLGMRKEKA